MANEYVTLAEMKTALSIPTSQTNLDADLAASTEAASRAVDGMTGTQFYLTSSQTRKYTPVSEEYVLIDEASTITAVTASGATLNLNTDYAQTETPVGVLRSLNGFRFPRGTVNGVTVTGTFGWSSPPADVKRATLILASRIFQRSREAPFGVIGFAVAGGGSVLMPWRDPDVVSLLRPYTRSGMVE